MFYFLYVLRRLFYVTIAFNLEENVTFQLMLIMYMNIFFVLYQGHIKPLEARLYNRIELFNEFLVGCCTFYALCFTDWVPTKKDQSEYGYHLLAILGVLIIVNIFFILYYSGRAILFFMYKGWLYLKRSIQRTSIAQEISSKGFKATVLNKI